MNDSKISVRYAKAIFELAKEKKQEEAVKNDLININELINESPEFEALINNPVIESNKKYSTLKVLFEKNYNPLTISSLNAIFQNNRESSLKDIVRNFLELYQAHKGILSVSLTTVSAVNAGFKTKLLDLLKKQYKAEIELTEKTDPNIIGGFILKIKDVQINASLQNQIKKLKHTLLTA